MFGFLRRLSDRLDERDLRQELAWQEDAASAALRRIDDYQNLKQYAEDDSTVRELDKRIRMQLDRLEEARGHAGILRARLTLREDK